MVSTQYIKIAGDDPQYFGKFCLAYISANNGDIDTQISGDLFLGNRTSFMMSMMTLSYLSSFRNCQCLPSTPLLDPPFLTHL